MIKNKKIISVTDITSYLFCPRKLYLKKVKGIKEKPNKKMVLGFLKHKVFELFNKNESIIVSGIKQEISEEKIVFHYKSHLKSLVHQVSSLHQNLLQTFSINITDLVRDVFDFMEEDINLRKKPIKESLSQGFFGKEIWKNLKPKYITEYKIISEKLGLVGKIDRVKFENKIVPYEIKTRDKIYYSDKIQLAAYILLLEDKFKEKIYSGIIETNKGKQEIIIDEKMRKEVLEIAEKIRNFNREQEPKFHNNFAKCSKCKLRDKCFD